MDGVGPGVAGGFAEASTGPSGFGESADPGWVGKEMERKVSGPIRSIGSRASPNGVHLPPHLQQRVDRWVIERQTLKLPIEPYPDALLADIEAWKASRLVGATL